MVNASERFWLNNCNSQPADSSTTQLLPIFLWCMFVLYHVVVFVPVLFIDAYAYSV